MPEGAIWPAQKAAPATTSIVTALSVEAEVSAVLMRCLRLPAAHFLYSGVAFSLRQMALSSCKPSRNDRWAFSVRENRNRAALDGVQAHLRNSNTLSQYQCRYLPAQLGFGRSIASLPKGLFADVLLVAGLDGAEGDLLRLLLISPKKPTCHRCIPCVQDCYELPVRDSQSVLSKQMERIRGRQSRMHEEVAVQFRTTHGLNAPRHANDCQGAADTTSISHHTTILAPSCTKD